MESTPQVNPPAQSEQVLIESPTGTSNDVRLIETSISSKDHAPLIEIKRSEDEQKPEKTPSPTENVEAPKRKNLKVLLKPDFSQRRWKFTALALGLLIAVFLGRELFLAFTTENTDDAFVTADVHMISARVPGTVLEVLVKDNQVVKKGDVLVRLDPAEYQIKEKMAEADDLKAVKNFERWNGARISLPMDKLQYNANKADKLKAEAALEQAQLQLKYTEIVAPTDGKIGKSIVESGEQIQPGQALMALVEQKPWITANFREGQIGKIHPGENVAISVDALSGQEFTGKVDSVAPGSGATFSLLPPDNATGNFTKIVQRIPVKIVFDPDSLRLFQSRLVPGMSATVTVSVSGD